MLGEQIASEHGHVTTRRILPGDDFRYVKMEISFETEVEVLGVKGQNVGTYVVWERLPGQIYGEGQGMIMTAEGGAIWNGHGVGRASEDGGIAIAASIAFQTNVETLSSLNEVLALVEHHAHADGHIHSSVFAWTAPSH